jgi:hypothetical protein
MPPARVAGNDGCYRLAGAVADAAPPVKVDVKHLVELTTQSKPAPTRVRQCRSGWPSTALQHPLHPDLGVVAEHGGAILSRHHTDRRRRGVFTSVAELESAIDEYVAHHNTNPKPFIWTKSARDILQKVIRANSRSSSKQNETLHWALVTVRRRPAARGPLDETP